MTQTDVAPPAIVLFVNNPDYVDETYQRFMINRMRELLPYPEVPIRLFLRARQRTEHTEVLAESGRNRTSGHSSASGGAPSTRARRPSSRVIRGRHRRASAQFLASCFQGTVALT